MTLKSKSSKVVVHQIFYEDIDDYDQVRALFVREVEKKTCKFF